jgi:hypothetical protein
LKLVEIASIDLIEWGVVSVPEISAIRQPLPVFGSRLRKKRSCAKKHQNRGAPHTSSIPIQGFGLLWWNLTHAKPGAREFN